eukprot:scaffold22834_cov119-Isochrysis_galbana.AAC.3
MRCAPARLQPIPPSPSSTPDGRAPSVADRHSGELHGARRDKARVDELNDSLNLNRRAEGQARDADGRARVRPGLAHHLLHQVGVAVGHGRRLTEPLHPGVKPTRRRRRAHRGRRVHIDEAVDFDETPDVGQAAAAGAQDGQVPQSAGACGLRPLRRAEHAIEFGRELGEKLGVHVCADDDGAVGRARDVATQVAPAMAGV